MFETCLKFLRPQSILPDKKSIVLRKEFNVIMLKSIYIDNYALIEQLEIEFRRGLTIITGETGAGKTILLGALGLLLGKRVDTSVLKEKQKKCIVEGVFNIEGYGLESYFESNDLDYTADTLIRREINSNGKSRAFINDSPVTLDIVQELTLNLIDIHSQHQNLALNNENYIRWIIDAYAGTHEKLKNYQAHFAELQELKKKFHAARETYLKDKQDMDYLTHQFNQLHTADLKAGELEELEQKASILNHAEEIKSALGESISILAEEQTGTLTGLKQISDLLARIGGLYSQAEELRKRTEVTYIEIKDIYAEAGRYFNQVEFDPDMANTVNERIDLLNSLLHKYKAAAVDELIVIRDDLDAKLRKLTVGDYELENLEKALEEKKDEVANQAGELSQARKKKFNDFENQILHLIKQLGMSHASFSILHELTEPGEYGIDKIQFNFSANRNMTPMIIAKVASGGELSRLMLAIKYLISNSSGLPTIIFDEIDSGVSGEIADKVGKLIMEMATGMQVINITHLPQVASKGEHHFMVYKKAVNGTTKTLIRELDADERLIEVARMLSGDSITDAAIENAKVLLRQ